MRILDIVWFTIERLWQHRILVIWALLGLTAATTLALGLVLYVDAVNSDLLESQLDDPPFAFRFRYLGSWNGNIGQADVTSANAVVSDVFTEAIGLPATHAVTFMRSLPWSAQLMGDDGGPPLNLGALDIGVLEGVETAIQIVDGAWSFEGGGVAEGEPIPVLIAEQMLFDMGIAVGDTITASSAGAAPITLEVAALWATRESWRPDLDFYAPVLQRDPADPSRSFLGDCVWR